MAGFAKLIPAFTCHVEADTPSPVGAIAATGGLTHIAFLPDSGYIKSEPGYPIALDAVFSHGADFIKADPDGRHVRLEVQSLLRDKTTGGLVRFNYTGTINMAGLTGTVMRGEAGAATTDFGSAFTHCVFETGSPELAEMQHKVYVASGRFILEDGKPMVVEYKISEVAL